MNRTMRSFLCALALALLSLLGMAQVVHGESFTVITDSSGLGAIFNTTKSKNLFGLELVDLDGDGFLDAFGSIHSNAPGDPNGPSKAALNDGHGHFTLATGFWPTSEIYHYADINNDGEADLSMRYNDGPSQWWINNSTPGHLDFKALAPCNGHEARQQATVDLNRDGKLDWIVGGRNIEIFLNNGTPTIWDKAPNQTINLGVAPWPNQATSMCIFQDIDGDGQMDLLTSWGQYALEDGQSKYMHNDGDMKFSDKTAEAGLPAEPGFTIIGAVDVNRDGAADIIAIKNRTTVVIYLNDGKGHFAEKVGAIDVPGGPHSGGWGWASMTDLDNDGNPDLLIGAKSIVKILRGTGGGNFVDVNKAWGIRNLGMGGQIQSFGDMDGDGRLDVIGYSDMGKMNIEVYHNDLPAKNWVNVRLIGAGGNREASGSKIRLYAPGAKDLLWYEQVLTASSSTVHSYYEYGTTERHMGLDARTACDVEVEFYPSGRKVKAANLAANKTWVINEDGTTSELTAKVPAP